jgi:hypothetical protein
MDTGLTTDTLSGVQPTLIGSYMIDSSQVPPDSNCQFGPKANGFRLQQPGFHCDVRYNKQSIVDNESKLLGLDKLITKQEPPANMIPKPTSNQALDSIKNINVSSFQAFEAINSRTKRSCNVLSEVSIDRFEHLHNNPQIINHIVINEPYRGGFQTRINTKDCHVAECGSELRLQPAYGSRCARP